MFHIIKERMHRMRHRYKSFPIFALPLCIGLLASCGAKAANNTLDSAIASINALSESELSEYAESVESVDPIGPYYNDSKTKEATLGFFTSLTRSANVARVILDNAEKYGVRPSLAFALAHEESDFKIDAYNANGDSVDRGLFQLNSKSYPKLRAEQFYDLPTNARYGISHLKTCLTEAGNEVAALAMYNAGNGRVTRGATPKKTLNYISRILAYEENVSSLFAAKVIASSRSASPSMVRLVAENLNVGLIADAVERGN
jgi:soluble lytic murein transglycosylase-like protein